LPIALDIVSDLVLHPIFTPKDIVREKGVILEEIKMDEDNPDYLVHEIFTQSFWKDHPLGKPILGTKETVRSFEQEKLFDFYRQRFAPNNMIISAAGNLNHAKFVELIHERFAGLASVPNGFHQPAPAVTPRIITRNKKSLEQVQLCLGVPSHPISHEKRYVSYVLNTVLGGGMSSRLFQKIREEQGLAYAIYSDLNPYRDTGCMTVGAGTSLESTPKVVDSVLAEFREMKSQPIPDEELRRAKDQLKGSLMLSLESSTSRMSNLARQQMYFERFFTMDETIEQIESVTADEVSEMARELFNPDQIAITVLGNLDGLKLSRENLVC
jgi:predicted Zn-dependent peptidase